MARFSRRRRSAAIFMRKSKEAMRRCAVVKRLRLRWTLLRRAWARRVVMSSARWRCWREQVQGAAETAAGGEFVDAAALDQDAIAHLVGEGGAEVGDVLVEFAAGVDDEFGGGGWRRGAHVGDEIGDGEIGFVAYAGDHRDFGGGDCAGDDFFVEGPEIFEGATATGDDQDVNRLLAVEELDGADDFRGGAIALHANGIESELHVVEAAAENADNVADGGTGGRGDEADAAREDRQGLLAGFGEEAFGFEALFQLVEGQL